MQELFQQHFLSADIHAARVERADSFAGCSACLPRWEHLGVPEHITLMALAEAKDLCSEGFYRASLKGLHLFPTNRHVPVDSCCMRESRGKWNLVEAKLPSRLFNTHERMGNNANNMPPPNRPVFSIKPRQHHLAAVVVQVGKKKSLNGEQLAPCAFSVDPQTPSSQGLIP